MATTAGGVATGLAPKAQLDGKRFARPSLEQGQLMRSFAAIAQLPSLRFARRRVLELLDQEEVEPAAVVTAIEADPALVIAVLRRANADTACATSVAEAYAQLGAREVRSTVAAVPSVAPGKEQSAAARDAEGFRMHALTTQRIAERVRAGARIGDREEVALVALLHDIGKLSMLAAFPRYRELSRIPGTPEQLVALERRTYGLDHAAVGAVVVGRLGLPSRIGLAIEHHHDSDVCDEALVVRLADMLAHHLAGDRVNRSEMDAARERLDLGDEAYEALLYGLPLDEGTRTPRLSKPPMSDRQAEVLRRLADGMTYKEIADSLGVSESTIRSHLHLLYKRLGVADRAQAVLLAARSGWLD